MYKAPVPNFRWFLVSDPGYPQFTCATAGIARPVRAKLQQRRALNAVAQPPFTVTVSVAL